jgi:hypothetical protein
MSPESIQNFIAVGIGFAFAGALASLYQSFAQRPVSFKLLETRPAGIALASVPLLIFAAPFIIMRNTVRGARLEDRRFQFVMFATVLAGFWSMMSGTLVLMALKAVGVMSA